MERLNKERERQRQKEMASKYSSSALKGQGTSPRARLERVRVVGRPFPFFWPFLRFSYSRLLTSCAPTLSQASPPLWLT